MDFFPSDRLRSEGDYNREVSRSTPWRNNIRNVIKSHIDSGYRVIVFEIHSFPSNYSYFDPDCLGMFSIPSREKNMNFLSDFINKHSTIKVCPVKTQDINDLQWDFNGLKIDHYFIEFSEQYVDKQSHAVNYIYSGALAFLESRQKINILCIVLVIILCCVIHKLITLHAMGFGGLPVKHDPISSINSIMTNE